MSRADELARQAIARHQLRGIPLEDAIAWAIHRAVDEQAAVGRQHELPRAMGAIVALLEQHRELTPTQIGRMRSTRTEAARQVLYRLMAAGVVRRLRRGAYALADGWRQRAYALAKQLLAQQSEHGRRGAEVVHSRHAIVQETA